MKTKCCYIGCERDAEFEVWDTNDSRPDSQGVTQACVGHLGALIGSCPPVEAAGPWTVVLL